MVGAAILAQVLLARSLHLPLVDNRPVHHAEPAADIAEGRKLVAVHVRLHRHIRRASVATAERVLEAVRRPCDFVAVRNLRTVAAVDIVAREGQGQGNHATAADRDLHYHAEDRHSRLLHSRASDSDLRNHAAADHLHGLHIHSAALRNLHTHFDIHHHHALAAARRTRDLHRRTRRTLRHTDDVRTRPHDREIHVTSPTHDVHAFHDAFRACSTRDVPLFVNREEALKIERNDIVSQTSRLGVVDAATRFYFRVAIYSGLLL
jgi:hypothetical protein